MKPNIPALWLDSLSNARVCTSVDAKSNISRLSRNGGIALREACLLLALQHCKGSADTGRIERLTAINAVAAFFVADSLAVNKGYVKTDRGGKHTTLSLTDKGKELVARYLS